VDKKFRYKEVIIMVHIIADTTACLDVQTAEKYHIPVIPQVINFGADSYLEGVNMNIDEFLVRLKASSELPKTAAPPIDLFQKEFQRLVPTGEPIVCIHPSTEVSGTVRSATIAAQDFPNADIRILDTRLVASPLGTIVQLAAEWAADGLDADTIVKRVMEMSARCKLYFLVDTLEFLAKGGRIGGAAALLGSVLQIKPILRLNDGRVDQFERERTTRRALERLKEIVCEQAPKDGTAYLSVLYAGNHPEGSTLGQELGQMLGQKVVPVVPMPPAIVTHGGPGILGVGFFTH
jgi:DegV family protein with EDD domain